LRSKDEAPEVIKTFLKKIQVLLQAPVIIRLLLHATLKTAPSFTIDLEKHHMSLLMTENRISPFFMYSRFSVIKNDREDIGKLGAKGLDLTYDLSTITSQKPTKRELDLLFEAMYDDYIGGKLSAAPRTTPATSAPQVLQTPTASTTTADTVSTRTNSSSQSPNIPNTSQDIDELKPQQQHVQQQDNQALL
ncbi:hypothetical protein Tco_1387749, partial [Tanacetum coccineum]